VTVPDYSGFGLSPALEGYLTIYQLTVKFSPLRAEISYGSAAGKQQLFFKNARLMAAKMSFEQL
jgi:hypothetical protein